MKFSYLFLSFLLLTATAKTAAAAPTTGSFLDTDSLVTQEYVEVVEELLLAPVADADDAARERRNFILEIKRVIDKDGKSASDVKDIQFVHWNGTYPLYKITYTDGKIRYFFSYIKYYIKNFNSTSNRTDLLDELKK